MSIFKKLAGQTAIYGLSSILGRLANYLVTTPLHTRVLSTDQFGVVTDIYAWVAFMVILFTYGFETAYFRYSSLSDYKEDKVYSTATISLLTTSFCFVALIILGSSSIAEMIQYPDHQEYIIMLAFIVGADALTSLPFARLRNQGKAKKFAFIQLFRIFTTIVLNLVFYLPRLLEHQNWDWSGNGLYNHYFAFYTKFIDPDIGVGYVFIANLLASLITLLLLAPDLIRHKWSFDGRLWKRMFRYSYPLLLVGLAGVVNTHLDKILLKSYLPGTLDENLKQLGVYGAVYKLSILITLVIQAFQYAADPFFFNESGSKNSKEIYAKVMNYFVIVIMGIMLTIVLFIDIIKHFISSEFHAGIYIVPILLLANVIYGIYYNLSVWYKLSGQTQYGAYFSGIGALVTVILNIILIPIMGYEGSAWATLACFVVMASLSYIWGQMRFKIDYDLKRIFLYIGITIALFTINSYVKTNLDGFLFYFVQTLFLLPYLVVVYIMERPKKILN